MHFCCVSLYHCCICLLYALCRFNYCLVCFKYWFGLFHLFATPDSLDFPNLGPSGFPSHPWAPGGAFWRMESFRNSPLYIYIYTCRIQNPDLSNPKPGHTTGRSGRVGARRGGEGGRGWVGRDAVGSIRPGDNPPSCPPANRGHCPGRLFGSTDKRNPM